MLPKETKRVRSDVDVTQVVLAARDFARRLHFSEVESRAIGTAVSELATNILKYAEYGQVTIREVREGGRAGIEAVATDHGPGIEDIREALQDHFSSSGTLGLGLPGVAADGRFRHPIHGRRRHERNHPQMASRGQESQRTAKRPRPNDGQ